MFDLEGDDYFDVLPVSQISASAALGIGQTLDAQEEVELLIFLSG